METWKGKPGNLPGEAKGRGRFALNRDRKMALLASWLQEWGGRRGFGRTAMVELK